MAGVKETALENAESLQNIATNHGDAIPSSNELSSDVVKSCQLSRPIFMDRRLNFK